MDIFLRTETNIIIPITIEADWTVGDLKKTLYAYSMPLLSYQGVELLDSTQPIADTGICAESVVNVRKYMVQVFIVFKKSYQMTIILDLEKEIVYTVRCENRKVYIDVIELTIVNENTYKSYEKEYKIINKRLRIYEYEYEYGRLISQCMCEPTKNISITKYSVCNNYSMKLFEKIQTDYPYYEIVYK